jgi:phosphohistidine swiveling domain-containing protein
MATYGMRGPSEIDISRNRWREDPRPLIQMLIGNVANPVPGAHRVHYNKLITQGQEAAEKIIAAAPLHKKFIVRRLVSAVRRFVFIREHPKFLLIRSLWIIKQTLFECADILVQRGLLSSRDDIFFLHLPEIYAAMKSTSETYQERVNARREELAHYRKMTPPRAITSQGEILTRSHKSTSAPDGSLVGSPASPGVIEGIAKVVLDPTRAVLEAGEILIAPFTDPGWTPLFMNAKGLVMEVGGLMTHGSVVAREYGIPAVVCVPDATKTIQTGQRLRVNGDEGWVQIL